MNNNQTRNNNQNVITNDNSKGINLSKTLAVVSSIKLTESVIMTATPTTITNKNSSNDTDIIDKQKITHAKPNFTLPQRKPIMGNSTDLPINSMTHHTLEKKSNVGMNKNSNGIKINNATGMLISKQPSSLPSQSKTTTTTTTIKTPTSPLLTKFEAHSSILPKKSSTTTTPITTSTNQITLPPSPSLSNGNHLPQSTKINIQIDKIPLISNASKVDIVKSSIENNDKQKNHHITESMVANKKALFEKKTSNGSLPSSMSIKPIKKKSLNIENTMNRLRNVNITEPLTQQNAHLNSNGNNNDDINDNTHVSGQSSSTFNIMRNKFCQDQTQSVSSLNVNATGFNKNDINKCNNYKSNNNNIVKNNGNKFEQKTFVSFSKDLQDAPNRYPEKIHVTKTITKTERYVHHQTETVFQNVRFSIDDQAHVVPKLK